MLLRSGQIQDPFQPVFLRDRAEADRLHLSPGGDHGNEGRLRGRQRVRRRIGAERLHFGSKFSRSGMKRAIGRPHEALDRPLDGAVGGQRRELEGKKRKDQGDQMEGKGM